MIECPQCGKENRPPGAEFCERCGANLTPDAAVTSGQQSQASEDLNDPNGSSESDQHRQVPGEESILMTDPSLEASADDSANVARGADTLVSDEHTMGAVQTGLANNEPCYPSTNEIELPEEPYEPIGAVRPDTDSPAGRAKNLEQHVVHDDEMKRLITNLQSKIPSMINNAEKPGITSDASGQPSATAVMERYQKSLEPEQSAPAEVQPRGMIESDTRFEAESMSTLEQRIRSFDAVTKSKGIAHFSKNEVRFPGGVKFRSGDEIRFNGKAYALRPKPRDYKTFLLYGALAAVLILLIASQMMRQSEAISPPSLVGVVMDQQTGAVMPDVKITLNELGKSVMSNRDGMFVFEILPEGEYTITGETPFFKTASLSLQHGKHGQTLIGLEMEESTPLVRDKPPAEARKNGAPTEAKTFGSIKITTDVEDAQVFLDKKSYGKGSRTIEKVYEGRHKLVVKSDGYETYSATVTVRNDETALVNVTMQKTKEDAPITELRAADYVRMGDSAAAVGGLAGAIKNYSEALELEGNPETYYRRAQTYHQAGKLDQARRDFSLAGNKFAASGQVTSAIGAYNAVLDLFPNDFRTLRARGYAYIQKGDYELALVDFETACERDGENYQNRIGLGHAYSMIGKYKEAIKEYKKAEDLTDDKAEVYALVALASLARGKDKDAKKYYEKFLESATPDIERKYAADPEWQRLKQMASSD